ncbi:mediator of RNA polymerase II transcription subunit 1-like [Platysternon megacephalum]|uniref:Mediator of RNA polymerase II transcription subunit 1-like n=1 Tax=Platysternon megacephalum TaxID=55544 RepID=A0A4D9E2C3_9SAUR|nr:mediator of RNA polymerase II transcription subunit 1-like [Platysternon megacephalum]
MRNRRAGFALFEEYVISYASLIQIREETPTSKNRTCLIFPTENNNTAPTERETAPCKLHQTCAEIKRQNSSQERDLFSAHLRRQPIAPTPFPPSPDPVPGT